MRAWRHRRWHHQLITQSQSKIDASIDNNEYWSKNAGQKRILVKNEDWSRGGQVTPRNSQKLRQRSACKSPPQEHAPQEHCGLRLGRERGREGERGGGVGGQRGREREREHLVQYQGALHCQGRQRQQKPPRPSRQMALTQACRRYPGLLRWGGRCWVLGCLLQLHCPNGVKLVIICFMVKLGHMHRHQLQRPNNFLQAKIP